MPARTKRSYKSIMIARIAPGGWLTFSQYARANALTYNMIYGRLVSQRLSEHRKIGGHYILPADTPRSVFQ